MDNQIYQREMMDFIKKFPNNGNVMIPIHGRTKKYGTDAYFQCRLFSLESSQYGTFCYRKGLLWSW